MNDFSYDIVASTRLIEKSPNFLTAILSGKFFTAEYFPLRKRIALSMGISHASSEQKQKLLLRLTEMFSLHQDDILFDNHSVCLVIPAEEEWLPIMDRMIESMETWATENSVSGGCFLCGCSDPSVNVSEVGEIRSILCRDCRATVKEEIVEAVKENKDRITAAEAVSDYKRIYHIRGMFASVFSGIILSWLWSAAVVNLPLPFVFSFLLTGVIFLGIYEIYKRVADSFSMRGFLMTTISGAIIVLTSLIYSLSMLIAGSETALRRAAGIIPSAVSSIDVFLNLPTYFSGSPDQIILIATCVMTAIGFVLSVVLRIILERSDR